MRFLLVDRNDDLLAAFRAWLAQTADLRVVGTASTGAEALRHAEALTPDFVVADVQLPDVTGFDLTRWLKALRPAPLVVLTTFHPSQAVQAEALAAGADGCVSKHGITDVLPALVELLIERRSDTPALPGPGVGPSGETRTRET